MTYLSYPFYLSFSSQIPGQGVDPTSHSRKHIESGQILTIYNSKQDRGKTDRYTFIPSPHTHPADSPTLISILLAPAPPPLLYPHLNLRPSPPSSTISSPHPSFTLLTHLPISIPNSDPPAQSSLPHEQEGHGSAEKRDYKPLRCRATAVSVDRDHLQKRRWREGLCSIR